MNNISNNNEFKACIVGEYASGKTCLTNQIVHSYYMNEIDPTIEDQYRKSYQIDGNSYFIDICDLSTYHEEEDKIMYNCNVTKSNVIIITMPCEEYNSSWTNFKTFQDCYNEFEKKLENIIRVKDSSNFPCVIALTKCDITTDNEYLTRIEYFIRKLIRKNLLINCEIVKTSAKANLGIDELLKKVVKRFHIQIPTFDEKNSSELSTNSKLLENIISNENKIYKKITNKPSNCLIA